jgi:hypothetical protein
MQSIAKLSEFASHLQLLIGTSESVWTDAAFGDLALRLYELQCELNQPYRSLCFAGNRAGNPKPQNWKGIPAVPTSAFKDMELSCLPTKDRNTVFHSSGTTKHRPSRHFHNDESLAVYEESLLASLGNRLQIERRIPIISLTPSTEAAPHSSLVYMFETLRRTFGSEHSAFVGKIGEDGGWTLNVEAAVEALRQAAQMQQPIVILGTAFLYVHLLDYLTDRKINLQLPVGTMAMETGGYKGRSRAVPKQELHSSIAELLGILEPNIICEYGMSELSSQAYDYVPHQFCRSRRKEAQTALLQKDHSLLTSAATRLFHFPPWARVQIISPETGREVNQGETGLIRVFDLANVFSVMAIQTEDLGIRRGDGFELVGRASLAEARGCSLMAV